MKSRHESRSDDTKTRTASEMMNMYRDSTLRGAGGRMPKRRITNARASTSTACRKRERKNLIGLFQGEEEGHRSTYSFEVSRVPKSCGMTPGGNPATV